MALPAGPYSSDRDPVAPPADPRAIRVCLTPALVAEFDREWDLVLDEAKRTHDLTGVQDLIGKWRHIAYGELVDPGRYYRMMATVARTLATGQAPEGSISGEEMKALLRKRLGR